MTFFRRMTVMGLLLIMILAVAGCGSGGGGTEQPGTEEPGATQPSEYPTRPISVIIPMPAGSSTDLVLRPVLEAVSKELGQSVVPLNKAGGGGVPGTAEGAKAAADGYTLTTALGGIVVLQPMYKDTGYTLDTFKMISLVAEMPFGIAVKSESRIQSIADLMKLAKEEPGKIKVGNPGAQTAHHVTIERLARLAGGKLTSVPFDGGRPGVAALLAGDIDVMISNVTDFLPEYKAGQLRLLAVTSDSKYPYASDVSTLREQGVDIAASTLIGLAAPAGVSEDIVTKLSGAVEKALQDQKVAEAHKNAGVVSRYLGPEEFTKAMKDFAEANLPISQELGWVKK